MQLGKANYGTTRKTFKLLDGDNVYRILPPMGDAVAKGTWAQYYAVVWGYKDSSGKQKPFQDPSEKNRSNGMIEKMSAALDRRIKLEDQKKKMKEAGASKEQMEKMNDILKQFNIEKKYYLNVVSLTGEIGLLKVGYKIYKALTGDKKKGEKGLIDRLLDQGVDPVSSLDNGRFINFHRQGKMLDTTYTVTVYQEEVEINGKKYKEDKVHKIDQNLIDRLDKEAFNLVSMYPSPTLEEVDRIVKEGPTAVDEILGKIQSAGEETSNEEMETQSESAPTAPPVETKTEMAPPVVETKVETPVAPPVETKVSEPAKAASDLDPDEFLKSMGVNVNS